VRSGCPRRSATACLRHFGRLPELPLREAGLGETAPANLYHWVSYPAAAYAVAAR